MSKTSIAKITPDRELRELLYEAEERGFEVTRTSGGHVKLLHPDVDRPLFGPTTPSDHRSVANFRSQIYRAMGERILNHPDGHERLERAHALVQYEASPGVPEYHCPACLGNGVKRHWTHPAGLIAHMEKEHPVESLADTEVDTEETTELDTEEQEQPVAGSPKKEDSLTVGELEEYLLENHGDGSTLTLHSIREAFPRRNPSNAIANLKRRETLPNLQQWGSPRSRLYRVVIDSPGQDEVEEAPQEGVEESPPGLDEPPLASPSTNGHGRLYETVNQFVDGKYLVKDDEGNLFVATLEPLT